MNVLILGSGGREHALAEAVSKSSKVNKLYVMPGNLGTSSIAENVDIDPLNNDKIKEFCTFYKIDLILPGSEVFLSNGIADAFLDTDIQVFGPSKNAAKIETSKTYAKVLMNKYHIPTADYKVFDEYENALSYVEEKGCPVVLKYDGLAAGKGVVVCFDMEIAKSTLKDMLCNHQYGTGKVIVEDYLDGPEFSFMCFVHKDRIIPMPIAQDHKRLLDKDQGPNTGGMGAYSPVPIISDEIVSSAYEKVMKPIVLGMVKENNPFTGFLYGGLIATSSGVKVIEFNARFGDPEAEVILPKLQTDIIDVINSLYQNKDIDVLWDDLYHIGVVLASKGYPRSYEKGFQIKHLDLVSSYYHMGTVANNEMICTNGGRVLIVTEKGKTLKEAQDKVYEAVKKIECDNLIYRSDIGSKGIN
jgi:phosphoribosylamine--glycine ligase